MDRAVHTGRVAVWRIGARVLVIVGLVEFAVMYIMAALGIPEGSAKNALDAALLALLSAPLIDVFVIRGIARGITERENLARKASEQELALRALAEKQDLQDRLVALMENVPGTVYSELPDSSITYIGEEVRNLTGYAPVQFTSGEVRWKDLIHPDDRSRVQEAFSWAVSERRATLRTEYRLLPADGNTRWIEDRRRHFYGEEGRLTRVDGLIVDVTEKKAAEEELQSALRRIQEEKAWSEAIVAAIGDGVSAISRDFRVIYQNQVHREIMGDCVGRFCYEAYHGRDAACERCPVARSFADGRIHRVERQGGRNGLAKYLEVTASPLRDYAGNIVAGVEVVRDITARRELESRMRTMQRMESVGTLAGGIAHDFNNALTGILGFAELLRLRVGDDPAAASDIDQIVRSAERASTLTRQLLSFARRQVLEPEHVSLNTLIEEMLKLLRKAVGEHIRVTTRLAPGLPAVFADPGQFEQVIMNLALNARDAMPEGGEFVIETQATSVAADDEERAGYMEPGRYVLLTVSDTGTGMDRAVRERAFDPFFTTKKQGKGTGLGLAMVYGIVKQHNGYILLDSKPGAGTTFRIYRPPAGGRPTARRHPRAAEALRGGTETVLVAEDDESVRRFVARALAKLGYTVLEAEDGNEAIAVCRNRRDVALVILDVVMPRTGGLRACEEIRAAAPQVRILFMSGHSADFLREPESRCAGAGFLQKPFTRAALAAKVREILDSSR